MVSSTPGEQFSPDMMHSRRSVAGPPANASTEAQDEVFMEVEWGVAPAARRSTLIGAMRSAKPQQGPGAMITIPDLRCKMYNTYEPFRTSWETVVWDYDKARLARAHSTIEAVALEVRGVLYEDV